MDKIYKARQAMRKAFIGLGLNSEEVLEALLQNTAEIIADHTDGKMKASHVRGWCDARLGSYLDEILDAKYPNPQIN
ncbi:hypothetical protein [Terasakiella sp.]|uniref:hypothetical protein n=1 Tax=Terasakiella sp. TaxID=2034861 RepID=UPI003AA7CDBF